MKTIEARERPSLSKNPGQPVGKVCLAPDDCAGTTLDFRQAHHPPTSKHRRECR